MANKIIKLMLDPGHDTAKYNQGAVAGYWEGERMWTLSLYVKKALEARGFVVGMTKSQVNQTVGVVARGRMAGGYDALISYHSNAAASKTVDRPVGIYFVDDNCGYIDEKSKELAKLLSDVVANTMHTTQSAQQYSQLSSRDRDGDGCKNDDYYGVLYGAHQVGVPAVILEHSFHTNPAAAEWLMDDGNLRQLAEDEADALAKYYGVTSAVSGSTSSATKEGTTVKMRSVKQGSKDAHVGVLQALLRGLGYTDDNGNALVVDNSYGPKTVQAVKKYQANNKGVDGKPLVKDGSCGPKTWGSILAQ